jgi:hypothetical protein
LWNALIVGALSAAGALAVLGGHHFAQSAVVDLGPTDAHYVRDFREIERDGATYFRWSSVPSSRLLLPLRFCGPGQIRLRVRRHFLDPALVSVTVSGTVLGQRSVQARDDHPYEIIEFKVPVVTCDSKVSVLLEASVENDRPLGVAVDWMEIRATAGFRPSTGTLLRGALLLALTSLAFLVAGSGTPLALTINGALAVLLGLAFANGPVAAERALRGGLIALCLTMLVGAAISRVVGVLNLSARHRTALAAITLVTLVSRAAFLHTQAFYPDYRVHALVQQTLNRAGLPAFLDEIFEVQYARSLGLQRINGNWYPFPYPPGAYVLTGGVGATFGLDPLDAAMVTAVTFASLIPILTLAMGLSLGLEPFVGLVGALYVSVQPLLLRRMALGYFPGLAGQFADAVAVLLLLASLRRPESPIRTAWLAVALLAAFLVYTQSIANFGLLIAGLLAIEAARKSPGGRTGAVRVAMAGGIALLASAGAFYWRYAPVFENAASHRPQPESRVLDRLEALRDKLPAGDEAPDADDLNDPYAGSTVNPVRGLARLGSRLWRFNGPFIILIAVGGWLLLRQSDRPTQNIILAWSAVAMWISLLAAGLPSPNGFQHLKDLEFVSPLVALAMGVGIVRLANRQPAAAIGLTAAWMAFVAMAFKAEWTERILKLTGL